MLNLPVIQNFTSLKLGPALKLLALVEKIKLYYFKTFVKTSQYISNNNTNDNNSDDMGLSETNNNMEINESSENEDDSDENFNRLD
jgi:hypothetical protein